MKKIDTDKITEVVERGEEYRIKDISAPDMSYVRTWAYRKGFNSRRDGNDAVISIEKKYSIAEELRDKMKGRDSFIIEGQTETYIRSAISQFNKSAPFAWKVKRISKKELMIYPDPVAQLAWKNDPLPREQDLI